MSDVPDHRANFEPPLVPDSKRPATLNQSPQTEVPPTSEPVPPISSKPSVVSGSTIPASSSQSDGKKGFHLWVDTLSKIALMIGAMIGGLWALKGYREITAPTLEIKTQINSRLEWPDRVQTPGTCWAEYSVSLKNDGTTPFTIESHEVTVWLVDSKKLSIPTTGPLSFLPLSKDAKIVYNKPTSPIDEDIQEHYPPGTESRSAGVLLFKKPKQGTFVVVMRIDVHGHTTNGDVVKDHSWTYDKLCR
jgi:hypothetical protein